MFEKTFPETIHIRRTLLFPNNAIFFTYILNHDQTTFTYSKCTHSIMFKQDANGVIPIPPATQNDTSYLNISSIALPYGPWIKNVGKLWKLFQVLPSLLTILHTGAICVSFDSLYTSWFDCALDTPVSWNELSLTSTEQSSSILESTFSSLLTNRSMLWESLTFILVSEFSTWVAPWRECKMFFLQLYGLRNVSLQKEHLHISDVTMSRTRFVHWPNARMWIEKVGFPSVGSEVKVNGWASMLEICGHLNQILWPGFALKSFW